MSTGLQYTGPRNPNPAPGESRISIYGYLPSLALALVALISFGIAAAVHTWWATKRGRMYRTFHILMAVGCLAELGGYAARTHGHFKPFRVDNFVAQFFLIVVAPVLFTAAIDLTLNILVQGIPDSERILLLKPRTVLIIFVTSDALCIVVQIAGAALVGATQSARAEGRSMRVTPQQASDILLAGLVLQVVSWVIFLAFLLVAIYRAHNPPRDAPHLAGKGYRPMRLFLYQVLVVTLLVLLRACYRVAETAMGFFTGIATSEIAFAFLEYVPIILAVWLLAVLPPSYWIEHPLSRGLREGGTGTGVGPSAVEKRGLAGAGDASGPGASESSVQVSERNGGDARV